MELYKRPKNQFVAGFIGSPKMNFVPGAALKSDAATIGFRPEHVALSTDSGALAGEVVVAEHLGSDTFLHVKTDHGQMTVRAPGEFAVTHGDKVHLTPDPVHLHRFNAEGLAIR